jgi:hypothetical protein
MIAVGIFIAGEWDMHNLLATNTSLSFDLVETEQPHVVLAKSGTRQEARQQNEGCLVMPNRDFSEPKTNGDEDRRLMKGLVF